jgi:hypothetical protein
LRDSKGEPHARGILDQPNPIPVRARVFGEGDGEEWIDAMARRWTAKAVFVTFGDEQLQTISAWLRPEDVRRRSAAADPLQQQSEGSQRDALGS